MPLVSIKRKCSGGTVPPAKKQNTSDGEQSVTTRKASTNVKMGEVRVAKYFPGKKLPTTPGYRNVLIHTKGDTLGGDLSPYILKNEQGCLLENIWQFSKVYEAVTKQNSKLSRFHPDVIVWQHEAEQHVLNDEVLSAYYTWREKGMNNEHAVRYPNGIHGRHKCLFSLWPNDDDPKQYDRLDYITARKKIYCGEYIRLAPSTPHFIKLQKMLHEGVNLQIIEVDGPDPSLSYPPYNQISSTDPGLLITEEVIKLLIEDSRKPFGHGYVIAALLLGGESWLR